MSILKLARSSSVRFSLAVLTLMIFACGRSYGVPGPTPEIDPSMGAGGLALLGGTILLIRGRRK